MEILGSRILLRPSDPLPEPQIPPDVLGLAIYHEFGPPEHPGTVFFLGQSLLEVSGQSEKPGGRRCGRPGRSSSGCRSATWSASTPGWSRRAFRSPADRGGSRGAWTKCGSPTSTASRSSSSRSRQTIRLRRDQR